MAIDNLHMEPKPFLPFPKQSYALPYQELYKNINGDGSSCTEKSEHADTWMAQVHCCRGPVLEKATYTFLHIVNGTVGGSPGSISRFESIAYPANPRIPALFVMADINETAEMGRYLVFYPDLIIQDGQAHKQEKNIFSAALKAICEKYNQDFEQHNSFITGRGVFGGCAGECGLMGFFQESDIPFLEEMLSAIPLVYCQLLSDCSYEPANDADYKALYATRARLIEWMIAESLGTKIMRENSIPLSIVEASSFPPVVKY